MNKLIPVLTLLLMSQSNADTLSLFCPEGQTLVGTDCVSRKPAHIIGYTCPEGSVLKGTDCVTTKTIPATVTYTCPSGLTVSGKTCIKTPVEKVTQ